MGVHGFDFKQQRLDLFSTQTVSRDRFILFIILRVDASQIKSGHASLLPTEFEYF